MNSSKVVCALVASIALVSAAPGGSIGGLGLGDTIGEAQGGLGGIIGQQGGLGGILGGNNGGGVGGVDQKTIGGITGGEGGLGGVLGGILGSGHGGIGEILGGILGSEGGLGGLLDLLNQPGLENILNPLLEEILNLVESLIPLIQNVIQNLVNVLNELTNILGQDLPPVEQAKAIADVREDLPTEVDTIFFIASQLGKAGGNGGVVPPVSIPPVSLPTPQTPEIPV